MKRLLIPAVLALAVAAAGCGAKPEPGAGASSGARQSLRVMLDYLPNADHAGLYAAQAGGEYAKAGLDVTLTPPPDPSSPLKLLEAGRADLAISYEPELLLARDRGETDLVAVAALVQKPLTSLMSIGKHPLRAASQLRGKRIGTAGIAYQSAYLKTIAQRGHVDPSSIKETSVGFNLVPAMLSGRVDGTLGAYWNVEAVDLRRRGKNPVAIPVDRLGVPTYAELVVVARKQELDENGSSEVRRFLQATANGYRRVRSRPQDGVDALVKADHDLDPGTTAAQVKASLPVFFPTSRHRPWGWQDRAAWDRYALWMKDHGLIHGEANGGAAVTTEFLAGQQLSPGPPPPGQG